MARLASWRSTPDELEYLANHSGARAIFVEAELAGPVIAARARMRGVPEGNVFAVAGERDDPRPLVVHARPGCPRLRQHQHGRAVRLVHVLE